MKYLLIAVAFAACTKATTFASGGKLVPLHSTNSKQVEACLETGSINVDTPMIVPQSGTTSYFGFSFSKDGSLMAFQLPEKDSEWRKVVILHVNDRTDLHDTLVNVIFSSLRWKDNEGIFYNRYNTTAREAGVINNLKEDLLFYHRVGTSEATDKPRGAIAQ